MKQNMHAQTPTENFRRNSSFDIASALKKKKKKAHKAGTRWYRRPACASDPENPRWDCDRLLWEAFRHPSGGNSYAKPRLQVPCHPR